MVKYAEIIDNFVPDFKSSLSLSITFPCVLLSNNSILPLPLFFIFKLNTIIIIYFLNF